MYEEQYDENADKFRFLGNCSPTPLLSQHFALSER